MSFGIIDKHFSDGKKFWTISHLFKPEIMRSGYGVHGQHELITPRYVLPDGVTGLAADILIMEHMNNLAAAWHKGVAHIETGAPAPQLDAMMFKYTTPPIPVEGGGGRQNLVISTAYLFGGFPRADAVSIFQLLKRHNNLTLTSQAQDTFGVDIEMT